MLSELAIIISCRYSLHSLLFFYFEYQFRNQENISFFIVINLAISFGMFTDEQICYCCLSEQKKYLFYPIVKTVQKNQAYQLHQPAPKMYHAASKMFLILKYCYFIRCKLCHSKCIKYLFHFLSECIISFPDIIQCYLRQV